MHPVCAAECLLSTCCCGPFRSSRVHASPCHTSMLVAHTHCEHAVPFYSPLGAAKRVGLQPCPALMHDSMSTWVLCVMQAGTCRLKYVLGLCASAPLCSARVVPYTFVAPQPTHPPASRRQDRPFDGPGRPKLSSPTLNSPAHYYYSSITHLSLSALRRVPVLPPGSLAWKWY